MSQRLLITAAGLLFFALLYGATLDSHGMLRWDEAEYASLGRSALRGEGLSISGSPEGLRLPLLPLSVAASLWMTGSESDVAARLPILLFSLLALLVVYASVRGEKDERTGWIAAVFLGLMPAFWQFTSVLLTEIPFMVFFTAAIICFYLGLYRRESFFYWSWTLVALALLTRYTGVLFGPIALFFSLAALTEPEARKRIRSLAFWLSPLLCLALLLPWLLRAHWLFGDFLAGFRMASRQLPSFLPELSMPWYFYPAHIPEMITPLLCWPLVIGIVWTVQTRDRFALHMSFVVVFILVWFSFYRFKEVRMAMPVLPFLSIIAALGATRATLPRKLTWRWSTALALFLFAVLGWSAVVNHRYFSQETTLGYPAFAEALAFLRNNTPPGGELMGASIPQIFWYTDRHVVDFPERTELIESLEHSDWVIVTDFERSQKAWVSQLASRIDRQDLEDGNAAVFQSGRFSTTLIRANLLRDRLEEDPSWR